MELYNQGQRDFGENRVQELVQKQRQLPEDINWHLIGHLQTNKVKQVINIVHLIHSIDSPRLLKEISKQAEKTGRPAACLLQFKIAKEESKYGFDLNSAVEMLESEPFKNYHHIQISGVMGMATFTDDMAQVRLEFRQLKNIFDQLKTRYFQNDERFREISMGMSGDYKIALEEGSTMVRIGSLIFGPRN